MWAPLRKAILQCGPIYIYPAPGNRLVACGKPRSYSYGRPSDASPPGKRRRPTATCPWAVPRDYSKSFQSDHSLFHEQSGNRALVLLGIWTMQVNFLFCFKYSIHSEIYDVLESIQSNFLFNTKRNWDVLISDDKFTFSWPPQSRASSKSFNGHKSSERQLLCTYAFCVERQRIHTRLLLMQVTISLFSLPVSSTSSKFWCDIGLLTSDLHHWECPWY